MHEIYNTFSNAPYFPLLNMKKLCFVCTPVLADSSGMYKSRVPARTTVTKYQKRISGPMLDRIDIHVEVPEVDYEKLSSDRVGESSASIRERVQAARWKDAPCYSLDQQRHTTRVVLGGRTNLLSRSVALFLASFVWI